MLRRPENSAETVIGEESAAHCDGLICGQYCEDEDGEPILPGPHHHLTVQGHNPETRVARYPIFGRY